MKIEQMSLRNYLMAQHFAPKQAMALDRLLASPSKWTTMASKFKDSPAALMLKECAHELEEILNG